VRIANIPEDGETVIIDPHDLVAERLGEDIFDYYLKSRVHTPRSFGTLLTWLYKGRIERPNIRADQINLLRTYIMAVDYDIMPLRQEIVLCFRRYHKKVEIDLSVILWLVHELRKTKKELLAKSLRNNDLASELLMESLLNDLASEVRRVGQEEFTAKNPEMFAFHRERVYLEFRMSYSAKLAAKDDD
jgi:DNA repair exonuclease SbcCD nuclease subunit